MPRNDQAIFRLSKAIAKLADYDTKPEFTASTREFFLTLAKTSRASHVRRISTIWSHSHDPKVIAAGRRAMAKDVLLHAIMRNTIAPVLMSAGFRSNVIPSSAEATINFRAIPGTTADDMIAEIKKVIGDPNIDIAPSALRHAEQPRCPKTSSTDTDLYQALVESANRQSGPAFPLRRIFSRRGPTPARGVPAASRCMEFIRIRFQTTIFRACMATTSAFRSPPSTRVSS